MKPILRFNSDAPLTSVSLSDIGTFYSGLSGKTKQDFGHGDSKFITYMNVFTNTVAKPEMCEAVSIERNEKQHLVSAGDLLFTQSSETPEDVGMASVWMSDESVYLNSFCFSLKLFDQKATDPLFLSYLLRAPVYRKAIALQAQGISRYNLSYTRLGSIQVLLPPFEEQKQIAAFFLALDEKIELIDKKIAVLKNLYRALSLSIFNQTFRFTSPNGDNYPEWQHLKIGDAFVVRMCKRVFKDQTSPDGDIPFYKIGTIGKIPDSYISKELFDEYTKKYNYPSEGDTLISCSGTVGNCVIFDGKPAYFQDSNIVWLEAKDSTYKYDKRFLSLVLENYNWGSLSSSTITRIYSKDLLEKEWITPCIEEQKQISDLLFELKKKIENASAYLEQLYMQKTGFMQQMFV